MNLLALRVLILDKKVVAGLLLLGLVAVISFYFRHELSFEFLKQEHDHLLLLYQEYPASFALIFLSAYIIYAALCFPGVHLFMLVSGAIFGWPLGILISTTGCSVGGLMASLWSRYLFKESVCRMLGTRYDKISMHLHEEGPYYLFAMHLTIGFPYNILNLAAGISPVSLRSYLLVLVASQTLAAIAYNFAGMQLAHIHRLSDIFSAPLFATAALIAITALLAHQLIKWWRQTRSR